MTMTATRRSNIIKAVRKGLLLGHRQASHVVDANWIMLATMEDRPLHDLEVVPVQSAGNVRDDWSGSAHLYVGEDNLGWIEIPAGLMKPVLTASIARAYGLPDDVTARYEAEIDAMMARTITIPAGPFDHLALAA